MTTNKDGYAVKIDQETHLCDIGKMHYINHKFTNVSISAGAMFYVEVPEGVKLHYSATYFSSTGGVLDAYTNQVVSGKGTEKVALPYNSTINLPLKSKAYYTPTVTSDGTLFRSIGVSGGTAVAGNGSTGSSEQRLTLTLSPGKYLLRLIPGADASTVIYDINVWEE